MDASIPLLTGAGEVAIVQVKQAGTYRATFDSPPSPGNKIIALVNRQDNPTAILDMATGGMTVIGGTMRARADTGDIGRLAYRDVVEGDPAGPYGTTNQGGNYQTTIFEVAGLPSGDPLNTEGVNDQSGTGVTQAITPTGGVDAWLLGGFASRLRAAGGGTPTFTPNASTTVVGSLGINTAMHGVAQPFYGVSDGSEVTLGGTQGGSTQDGAYRYGIRVAAFELGAAASISWPEAPDTVDENDGSSDDVTAEAIAETNGPFWRGDFGTAVVIDALTLVIGAESAGDVTITVQGGDAADLSDAVDLIDLNFTATGTLTADTIDIAWDQSAAFRYYQLVLETTAQDLRIFEVGLTEASVVVPVEPAKAILEIYVHDEDASRWGTATWATGAATGTEGIWSAAGWQDVTPQGVNAHIIWGSRRPGRGILAGQDPASWNVETYDPDRVLDPGNFDSPYYPQLVAGIPIRISHEGLVIRTGIIEELSYKHKPPDYRGQILATDTIALLHKAAVPADSILSDTLHARIIDAIEAAGIGVGGIPLPPPDYGGPTLAEWVEGAATDDPTSVWEITRKAVEEINWVAFVNNDASLGLRSWGAPLDRGREISAPNLEDLRSVVNEDGVYSVARVQVADPDLDPIEREASPLPRYGRRVIDRREPTIDPEGWADAVLAERSWPGVQYVPGAIHCFTAADVNDFGSLQIMERVTLTVPGAVSVQGRILGGELWAEHRKGSERGATWIFMFQVATDGATAIGLTTLVADGTGDLLLDDMTETDFLEAD